MKAGELYKLLGDTNCGDDVLIRTEDGDYEIESLEDNSGGKFILTAGAFQEFEDEEEDEA
jgi:hypothetical protein